MKKHIPLPKGYYAVLPAEVGEGEAIFTYKGVGYSAIWGKNLFHCLNDAYVAANDVPTEIIFGLDYEKFDTPVVLLCEGEHFYNNGSPRGRSINVDRSITLLGVLRRSISMLPPLRIRMRFPL